VVYYATLAGKLFEPKGRNNELERMSR